MKQKLAQHSGVFVAYLLDCSFLGKNFLPSEKCEVSLSTDETKHLSPTELWVQILACALFVQEGLWSLMKEDSPVIYPNVSGFSRCIFSWESHPNSLSKSRRISGYKILKLPLLCQVPDFEKRSSKSSSSLLPHSFPFLFSMLLFHI